jgi:hypothetical protein
MTNAEVLALTIARCDAILEEQLEATEILLIDLGASEQEIAAAVGPGGWSRRMLKEDCDAQIREVERWLSATTARCIEVSLR